LYVTYKTKRYFDKLHTVEAKSELIKDAFVDTWIFAETL